MYSIQAESAKDDGGRVEYESGARVPAMPTVSLADVVAVFEGQDEVKDVEERCFGGAESEGGWVWQVHQ
jgi:hypothetical protein